MKKTTLRTLALRWTQGDITLQEVQNEANLLALPVRPEDLYSYKTVYDGNPDNLISAIFQLALNSEITDEQHDTFVESLL